MVIPQVTVDLRGHTLRGPGEGLGVTAGNYPGGYARLSVLNGKIENWLVGVGGDYETRATNLRLVGNRYGFYCSGNCTADRIAFKGSSAIGIYTVEGYAVVTRSTFSGNQTGAKVYDLSGLVIQRSKFVNNDVGVFSVAGRELKVSFSAFRRNGTAILVDNGLNGEGCADLYRVKYKHNDRDLVGPTCS